MPPAEEGRPIFVELPIRHGAGRTGLLIHFVAKPAGRPALFRVTNLKYPAAMGGHRGHFTLADNALQPVEPAGARGPQLHFLQQGQEVYFFAVKAFGHPLLIYVFKHLLILKKRRVAQEAGQGYRKPRGQWTVRPVMAKMAEGPGVTPGYEGLEPKRSCSDPPSAISDISQLKNQYYLPHGFQIIAQFRNISQILMRPVNAAPPD